MIITKLGWLIMEIIFMAYFLYFGSSPALALFVTLLFIPIVTIPISWYVGKKVKVTVEADTNLRKGQEGNIAITIKNPTLFIIPWVVCRVCIDNQLNMRKRTSYVSTWLPAKGSKKLMMQAGSDYCGRLSIRVERGKIYDCFSLVGIGFKTEASAYMTVQPETFETAITLIPNINSNDNSDVYSQERMGNDLSETFQIREYVQGDNPRQIHWKLSNKLDSLVVRDPSLPIIQNIFIFWERTGESGDLKAIDAQAEIIISLCKSLADLSMQFTIGWNDTDRNIIIYHEIKGMDELIGIIPRLMRATGSKSGISGAELLLQTSSHLLRGHMVYLAENPQPQAEEMNRYGHVTMIVGGETPAPDAKMYDFMHYEEQLSHIEL